MTRVPSQLSVQANNLLQPYNEYLQGKFMINRTYQQNLVWTVEEKERLIDSISKDLPIPLIFPQKHEMGAPTRREWK
jgi:uncharacterized protein with ParB-like and HNH nuclease domain